MFNSARIKLTAWYLVIIMAISITFSFVIYSVLLNEVLRFERAQRFRMERRFQFFNSPIPENPELIEEIKQRIILRLFFVNMVVLISSGGLGYMLAGRTLKPIKEMIDEQNRFISDASHELRTPLTSLKSGLEVNLRDKKLTLKDAREIMKENLQEVNRIQSLSDSLLELAQYQRAGNRVIFEKVDIKDIIDTAVKKVEHLAEKKKITVKNQSENYMLHGSRQGLTDLMVILLDNAIKYSPQKKEVGVFSENKDGHINIMVSDGGIGIAKKDLPFIFDRFYRTDGARTKTAKGGYGLGLSIAKKIVKYHNGSISVKSIVEKGTVFSIRLPKSKKEVI